MAWSYDTRLLGTDTADRRLNSVRILIGDTDQLDQQITNEEIQFSLSQNNDNIYQSAAFSARTIAAKYARQVNQEIDGTLKADYSDRRIHYMALAEALESQAIKSNELSVSAGGINSFVVDNVENNSRRVKPRFKTGQFDVGQTSDYSQYS